MKRKFDVKGVWWLPESEDYKLNGILHYQEDTSYLLELFGELKVDNKMIKLPIINGYSSDGVGYTLVDSVFKTVVTNMPGFPETTIHVSFIYENIIIEKYDDLRFNSVSVSFSSLDNWLHTNGFGKSKSLDPKDLIIKYSLPDIIENKINDDFCINIKFLVTTPTYTTTQRKMQIKQKIEIEIMPSKDRDLSYFYNIIMYFRHFLMLALNANVKKRYIKIKPISSDNIKTNNDKQVFVYFKDKAEDFSEKDISPAIMIFSYPSIKDRLNSLLNTWYKNHTTCFSAYTLYFETLYYKELNLENHCLNLSQTLESYHREKSDGRFMDEKEYQNTIYKKLIKNIPQDLEDDFRDSLKSKINYGYEFSFRRRLKELFLQNNEFLANFIPDYETLIKEIVETRNYYTHYDEKSKYVRTFSGLFELCEKMKVVFTSLLLFDLGFKNEEVRHFMEHQEILGRLRNVSGYVYDPMKP